jgi:hypothetical protein
VALEIVTHGVAQLGMSQQIPEGLPGKFFPHAVDDPDVRVRIAQRALAGESIAALAAEYGISGRTVMRYRDALSGGEIA